NKFGAATCARRSALCARRNHKCAGAFAPASCA
ncbi:hypothetical protein A2U01_0115713, partial [Trifolium medium]|nr:hypothetical protein [Trifolium medium]